MNHSEVECVPRRTFFISCPPDRECQVDFLHDSLRLDLRGTDDHNRSVVRLTKKSAAGEARGACSRQERILPDTFSVRALTAASNDPTVPDRQIDLLAGHSAGIKEHYVVRKNVQLACEAIERYYFKGDRSASESKRKEM